VGHRLGAFLSSSNLLIDLGMNCGGVSPQGRAWSLDAAALCPFPLSLGLRRLSQAKCCGPEHSYYLIARNQQRNQRRFRDG